jgi:2-methylcitrate dehydratase PrpD
MSVLNELAAFIAGLEYEDIPADVKEEAKSGLLDTVGAILAGSETAPGRLIAGLDCPRLLRDGATLLTANVKTDCFSAIRINCAMAHCSEIDSIHPTSIVCAAGMVIPAALAWAETNKSDGKRLIAAIVAGSETAVRTGSASGGEELLSKAWWPSSIFGPLGVCAAICKLEAAAPCLIENAIGINSTACGGLITGGAREDTARHFLYGWAACGGAAAFQAAKRGFTGPPEVLDGDPGLYEARGILPERAKVAARLGEDFSLMETLYKEFACAMQFQSATHGFLKLIRDGGLSGSAIKDVHIKLPAKALIVISAEGKPDNHTSAAAHGPYIISAAMLDGDVLPRQYNDDRLKHPDIIGFMEKVHIERDDSLDDKAGKWPARVCITSDDGGKRSVEVAGLPGGGPEDRRMFVRRKFKRVTEGILTDAEAAGIIGLVDELDHMREVTPLIRALTANARRRMP